MKALLLAGLAAVALQAQPAVQRFTLPNGLRVLHLEDHEHPLVRVRIHVRVEPSDTPAGKIILQHRQNPRINTNKHTTNH